MDDPTIFSQNDYVCIEEECVKITDTPNGARDITRAQVDHNGNATIADEHEDGVFVRERGGTEIMTHDFDGSDYLAGISISSERGFWAILEVDGEQGEMKTADSKYPVVDFVWPRHQPAAATWKVLVWATETRQFWGSMYN